MESKKSPNVLKVFVVASFLLMILLNALANHCHIKRHKFHPYVWEIANMVRQGVVDRDQGIEKIYSKQNSDMVNYAKERLDI